MHTWQRLQEGQGCIREAGWHCKGLAGGHEGHGRGMVQLGAGPGGWGGLAGRASMRLGRPWHRRPSSHAGPAAGLLKRLRLLTGLCAPEVPSKLVHHGSQRLPVSACQPGQHLGHYHDRVVNPLKMLWQRDTVQHEQTPA